MTLTVSPPTTNEALDQAAFAGLVDSSRESWLTTTEHRRLARLHLGAVLLSLLGTLVVGFFVRLEGADAAKEFFKTDPDRFFEFTRFLSAHAIFLPTLVIAPLWVALGTLVVPRQLGAARLAFPRLQALVVWLYVVGAGLLVSGFLAESGPPQASWFGLPGSFLPDGQLTSPKKGTDLVIAAVMVLTVSALLAAVNFVVSVVTMRQPGQKIENLRPFTVATFVTSAVTLLAAPVTLAGLFLTYLDLHFGGGLFQSVGGDLIWQHMVWLFGRPEAFLLLLPALGAIGDIVSARTRAPLAGGAVPAWLLVAFGALTLSSWAGGSYVADAVILPTARWYTVLPALPVGLLALVWLASFRHGVKPDATLVFVLGTLAALAFGLVVAIAAAIDGVSADSAVKDSFISSVVYGAPLIAGLGAVLHWAPQAWGRTMNQALTGLVGLAALAGVVLLSGGQLLAGLDGAPYLVGGADWDSLGVLSAVGAAMLVGAAALLVLNILVSVLARKGSAALDDNEGGLL